MDDRLVWLAANVAQNKLFELCSCRLIWLAYWKRKVIVREISLFKREISRIKTAFSKPAQFMFSQMLQNSTTYSYFPQDLLYSTTRIFIQIQPIPASATLDPSSSSSFFQTGQTEKRSLQLQRIIQACSYNDKTMPAIEFVSS